MDRLDFSPLFVDRRAAGQALAELVDRLEGLTEPIVLALPRGGVPVAREVARRLGAPMDVLVVRKLGAPGQEELALGAVATGGAEYLNEELIGALRLAPADLAALRERETAEVERRSRRYRGDRPWPELGGRSVIVVDDGAATGATILAAVAALRRHLPAEIVLAVPVAPSDTCDLMRHAADRVICLRSPEPFLAIGIWYEDFGQVSDEDVRDLLEPEAAREVER
jgi:putative phosphoribosyl transferase